MTSIYRNFRTYVVIVGFYNFQVRNGIIIATLWHGKGR